MPRFRISVADHSADSVDAMISDLQRLSYLARSSFEDDQAAIDREIKTAREMLGLDPNAQMDVIEDAALAQGDVVIIETTPNQWMAYYLKRGQLDQVRAPEGVSLKGR